MKSTDAEKEAFNGNPEEGKAVTIAPESHRRQKQNSMVTIGESGWHIGIPSRMAVGKAAEKHHGGESSWKVKAHKFFDRKDIQYTMIGLLVLDIIIIFTEILLLAEYPNCRLVERDCLACCPTESENDHGDAERWLAADSHHGDDHSFCEAGYDLTGTPQCDSHKWATVHTVEQVLFWTTITILVLFLIENLVEMAALGPKKFFSQLFLALDFSVVFISLVLELVFHSLKNRIESTIAVLVIFRIWRFVRIGHGLLEVSSELTSKEYECLFEYVKACDEKFKALNCSPPDKTEKVLHLLEGHQPEHH